MSQNEVNLTKSKDIDKLVVMIEKVCVEAKTTEVVDIYRRQLALVITKLEEALHWVREIN